MIRYIKRSIMAKLIIQFFIVGLIPLIVLGSLTYYFSKKALEAEAFNHIASINKIKQEQTLGFIRDRLNNLILLSRSQHIRTMLNNRTYQEMNPLFDYYMKVFGYNDIIVLNETGHPLYSAASNQEYEIVLAAAPDQNAFSTSLWKKIMETEEPQMTDIMVYRPDAPPALFMGAPVYGDMGELSAVLIFQINASQINAMVLDRTGMGETGETYLAGADLYMRTNSRFSTGTTILLQKVNPEAVEPALQHHAGTQKIHDYRGIEVLSAYSDLGLNEKIGTDFDWAIVTKVDRTEAFNLLYKMGVNTLWTVIVLIVLVALVGYLQSTMIARPINDLSYRIVMLNDGNFTPEMTMPSKDRSDEIGLLIKTYNETIKKFRKQIKRMIDSTDLLVSSISQISTTASQLATSASETSSSISEVSTTVEEVKQTSQIANEKAENVSKNADATAKISYTGKQATENTMTGIERINEEMNYIAESTVQLSEQTKSIEEIINTVSDIADQSNILSVNAAIEAAKAGEHGRGFAVVAQEVKSLADQSKEATNQVRAILEDIQKATAAAVMATERGTRTVREAVELSDQAGNAIDRLSKAVVESANAAMQITASNQQQFSGMDQLSQAMESINDATQQNLDSVKQLEDAIKGLEEMAHTMKDITSNYTI